MVGVKSNFGGTNINSQLLHDCCTNNTFINKKECKKKPRFVICSHFFLFSFSNFSFHSFFLVTFFFLFPSTLLFPHIIFDFSPTKYEVVCIVYSYTMKTNFCFVLKKITQLKLVSIVLPTKLT